MQTQSLSQKTKNKAPIVLLYGDTSVGKTVSSIISLIRYLRAKKDKRPMLMVEVEVRENSLMLDAVRETIPDLSDSDIIFIRFESWEDLVSNLANPDSDFHKLMATCGALLVDNISYLMNDVLAHEIQDERWNAQVADMKGNAKDNKAILKSLIASTKMSIESWGSLAEQMKRIMEKFIPISKNGKPIIFTAWSEDNPKYNRALAAAPCFAGKMFVKSIPAYFDLIGLVETKIKDGVTIYPPKVSFECVNPDEGDFMCKWNGSPSAKKVRPLFLEKII